MDESIFTKIIKGEIPCHKIYEDPYTYAFLDINPAQPGHTLVVPKHQVEFVWDLSDAEYQSLMSTVHKVARHIRDVMSSHVSELILGTDVPHAHVHLIPFVHSSELRKAFDKDEPPTTEALAAMARTLRMEDSLL